MASDKIAISVAVDLLVELITQAQRISALIQAQTAAGASTLTADQWATITGSDDSAENALNAAIAAAKASGH